MTATADDTRRADSGADAGASSSSPDAPPAHSPQALSARQAWHRDDLHVVLVHPQIPQNAGNVARTAAGTAVALHLVEPLGFELDDKKLKRAGLDYWPHVCVATHASWEAFFAFFTQLPGPKRLVGFSVYGDTYFGGPEFQYRPGDWLVYGSETAGLPPVAHHDILASGGALVQIPILHTHVRSLNLAVCVGVGVFEALRQLSAGQHTVAPRSSPSLEEVTAQFSPVPGIKRSAEAAVAQQQQQR